MNKRLRLILTLAVLVALYAGVALSGVELGQIATRLRGFVEQAGMWGPVVYCLGFVAGVLMQIPGMVFVAISPVLFGPGAAWALSLLAGNIAVNANFLMVRRVGGQPLAELSSPWARKLMSQLEKHPIRSVVLLRFIFLMLPPVTGALALTRLSAREHALGTLIGLVPPVSLLLWAELALLSPL